MNFQGNERRDWSYHIKNYKTNFEEEKHFKNDKNEECISRAMKGEIDHITSKVETLEMNQETAHTVSTFWKFPPFMGVSVEL